MLKLQFWWGYGLFALARCNPHWVPSITGIVITANILIVPLGVWRSHWWYVHRYQWTTLDKFRIQLRVGHWNGVKLGPFLLRVQAEQGNEPLAYCSSLTSYPQKIGYMIDSPIWLSRVRGVVCFPLVCHYMCLSFFLFSGRLLRFWGFNLALLEFPNIRS